jgi:hypothetical protein
MKIPAPIDEKNVCTDWIADVFDFSDCTINGNEAVGFINGAPVYLTWSGNSMYWSAVTHSVNDYAETIVELKLRLEEFGDDDNLVSEITPWGMGIRESFFFEDD